MSMKTFKSWRWLSRKKSVLFDGGPHGAHGLGTNQFTFMAVVLIAMLFIVYRITSYQYEQTEIDARKQPFDSAELEGSSSHNLLAIAAGIKQKENVDIIVQKFLAENFTVVLFHYDGKMNGWWDLDWSNDAIHITAHNQTKWWFAKRFLHPDVVSIYDYIFLWDEDIGVDNFHPGRYLNIVKSEGLQISQPALDRNSTEIHHRITIRKKTKRLHRRIYDRRGGTKCSSSSMGPPCTGYFLNKCISCYTEWVEGMAPVFSRSAWRCTWHLIQNDLIHGWGLDMKLGYCAQGDRTKKVGIVDSEYIFHQGIPSLGGASAKKAPKTLNSQKKRASGVDMRVEIRRQSTSELEVFKERWEKAVKEDQNWVDPYARSWFNPF